MRGFMRCLCGVYALMAPYAEVYAGVYAVFSCPCKSPSFNIQQKGSRPGDLQRCPQSPKSKKTCPNYDTCVATAAPTCPTFKNSECHPTWCGRCTLALGDYAHRIIIKHQCTQTVPFQPNAAHPWANFPPLPCRRPPAPPSPFDATSKWHASTLGYLGAPGAQPGAS